MKLLFVTNVYPPYILGGYEVLCHQVRREMERRGHTVTVLTSNHGASANEPSYYVDVHRQLQLVRPFGQPVGIARHLRWVTSRHNYAVARSILAETTPDAAVVWSQLRLTLGPARAAQDMGLPTAFVLHDEHIASYVDRPWNGRPRDGVRRWVDSVLLPSLTLRGVSLQHACCASLSLRQSLVDQGVPVEHARIVHQGIPLDLFPPRVPRAGAAHPIRLLYVGRLHPSKGLHTLIHGARALATRRPELKLELTLVGDGAPDYKSELVRLAGAGAPKVDFRGSLSYSLVPSVYRAHDIFVFPSEWQEPFGLTHLEAMASGLPVVATSEGGHRECLRHGQNALLYEAGQPERLASALEALIDDPDLQRRLAVAGRTLIEREYSITRCTDQLEEWLQDVLRAEGGTPVLHHERASLAR